jgi:hypothetical protein
MPGGKARGRKRRSTTRYENSCWRRYENPDCYENQARQTTPRDKPMTAAERMRRYRASKVPLP